MTIILCAGGSIVKQLELPDDHHIVEKLMSGIHTNTFNLTVREIEILHVIAKGKRAREIAVDLGISKLTVYKHVRNIYTKLGVKNRAQAIAKTGIA